MTDSITPRPEAEAAAAWWASRLGNATQDLGQRDPAARRMSADAFALGALLGRTYTAEQVDVFRRELAVTIEEHLRQWEAPPFEDAWNPDEPQRGSALRSFGCDYHPEPVLANAADRAGIKIGSLDLPMKTVMWVNPGIVRVSEGHSGDVVTVWESDMLRN